MKPVFAFAAILASCLSAGPAAAAESYDNCRSFITSLPATLTAQGTYCLKYNLATNITSGDAIIAGNNNVTIDCNGFRILNQGGTDTQAVGIRASTRANMTVRGCNVRGFKHGLIADGAASSGHVIEDSRFETNFRAAIVLAGTSHVVRRNQIVDNGGMADEGETFGIILAGDADIIDNHVDGVVPSSGGTQAGSYGIYVTQSSTSVIRGNTVRSIDGGNSSDYAISVGDSNFAEIVDNHLQVGSAGGNGNFGVYCSVALEEIVAGNRMYGYGIALVNCDDDGGNITQD